MFDAHLQEPDFFLRAPGQPAAIYQFSSLQALNEKNGSFFRLALYIRARRRGRNGGLFCKNPAMASGKPPPERHFVL